MTVTSPAGRRFRRPKGETRFLGSAVSAGLVLALGATGCGDSKEVPSGTLLIALPSQPKSLSPIQGDNLYAGNEKAFNGLLRYGKDLKIEPDLASDMPTRSGDGETVTVKLRDDVKFHDGTALTAKDVVFTYEAVVDSKNASPMATPLDSMESVRALNPTTVQFTLKRPDPAFYDKLQIGIVPEHLLRGRNLKTASFNRKPVGTGPYVIKEFSPGRRVVMQANAKYFRGTPKIKWIVFTALEDESARLVQLEAGSVDAAGVGPKLVPRLRDNGNYNVLELRTADALVAALPNSDPVLKDPAVRRALSYGVDREKLVEGALAGAGEPAYGPVMKGHWAYSPAAEHPFDPGEAQSRLDAAGWKQGGGGGGIREKHGKDLLFTLMYPAGDRVRKDIAVALASDMDDIGVDAAIKGVRLRSIEKRQDKGAAVLGYGTPYDPDTELYTLFHSKFASDDEDAFTNYPRAHNAQIDAALDSERSRLGRDERKQDFVKLQQELANDASWLWLVRLRHVVAISKRVEGVDPQIEPHAHGFSRGTSWNIEDWSLKPKQ